MSQALLILSVRCRGIYLGAESWGVTRVQLKPHVQWRGGSTLVANLTPGHTRGCTTWTMKVDGLHAVIIGSPNVNPGYILVGNKDYPAIATARLSPALALTDLTVPDFSARRIFSIFIASTIASG